MEILNSQSGYSITSPIVAKTNTENSVVNQQSVSSVHYHKDDASNHEQSQKQKPRLDIDKQAIQLVEQESANQSAQQRTSNTGYDKVAEQNYTAIAAYQSVENQNKRDDIQQVFGVDLLA